MRRKILDPTAGDTYNTLNGGTITLAAAGAGNILIEIDEHPTNPTHPALAVEFDAVMLAPIFATAIEYTHRTPGRIQSEYRAALDTAEGKNTPEPPTDERYIPPTPNPAGETFTDPTGDTLTITGTPTGEELTFTITTTKGATAAARFEHLLLVPMFARSAGQQSGMTPTELTKQAQRAGVLGVSRGRIKPNRAARRATKKTQRTPAPGRLYQPGASFGVTAPAPLNPTAPRIKPPHMGR